jgi:ribose transport system substrate-binding protein
MRRSTFFLLCIFVLADFISCKKTEQQEKGKGLVIAVIPKGSTSEFWKTVHAGANKAAAELGVQVLWKGPLKEDDREAQVKVVEDFISRGVSGIVLAPLDDTALRASVHDAVSSGIPVVIIDSGLKSDDFISFVATDNYKGGRIAGEKLAHLINGKGKVVMLRYEEGSASTSEREQGFMDALKKSSQIEIVSSNQYGGVTTESAYQASENLLARFKASDNSLTIQGIFCPNESTTFGMLRALQEGGWAGKVRFVGFDSSANLVKGLKDGQIDALVLQNPLLMGYLGVKTMLEHLSGKAVARRIDTGVTLVTRDNMNDPEINELINPDLKAWLGE